VSAGEFRQLAGWYREVYLRDPVRPEAIVGVIFGGDDEPPKRDIYRGRVDFKVMAREIDPTVAIVDPSASRFHSASIVGLVVGAMGLFVFCLYLWSWSPERRESTGPTLSR
jgi:hypothetical protein